MAEEQTGSEAVDIARAAAIDVAGADMVGEFLGSQDEADVLGTLTSYNFASLQPGYTGWFWSVSVSEGGSDDRRATVNDVVLLPGGDAIVAPAWTPYRDRIRPGDLSPGDLLPPEDDDLRLVPAWSVGDHQDTVDRYFAREVGLGRQHVLSLVGRDLAADRWYDGPQGPDNPIAEQAPGTCSSCGFLISLAGGLSQTFGVCANGDANADGRVVALTHGCGAHSAATLKRSAAPGELPPPILDTVAIDPLALEFAAAEPDEIVLEDDAEAPQVDEVAPEVDEVAPQVDEVVPEVDEAAPEVDEVAPEVDEAEADLDITAPIEVEVEAAPEVDVETQESSDD